MEGGNQFSIKPQALGSFHGLAPNIDNSVWSTNDINGQFRKKQPVPNTLSPIIMVQWKWTYVPLVVTMWHHLNIQPFSMEPWLLKLFWETKNSPSQTFLFFPKRFRFPNENLCASVPLLQRQAPKTKADGHGKPSFTEAPIFPWKNGGRKGEGLDGLEVWKAFMIKCLLCHLSSYGFSVLIWMDFGMTQKGKTHPLGFFGWK